MYASSAGYKTAIAASARTTRVSGKITLADSTELAIYPGLVQQGSLYVSEQCVSGEGLEIGNVFASELGVGILNPIGELKNLVVNGDFSDGATGWSAQSSVNSVTDGICSNTGNGLALNPVMYKSVNFLASHIFYARLKVRVTNAVCDAIKIDVGIGDFKILVTAPEINVWYSTGILSTAGPSAYPYIDIWHYYADAATANGKVMEVQYVAAIDLTTAFGAGDKPAAAVMDARLNQLPNNWFKDTVGFTDLTTVGFTAWDYAGAVIDLNFELLVGAAYEAIPLGVFNVTDIPRNSVSTALTALDNMILLDVDLGATDTTAETCEGLITKACATAGVTLATTHATFETYPNKALSLTLPANSSVKTCRDLIMWACQVHSTFARMNRAGALEILPLHSASVRAITGTERYSPTVVSDLAIKITGLDMKIGETLYTVGTTDSMMVLDGNPLLESQASAAIDTAMDAILADITQAEYTPFDIAFIGDPSLQSGDYITLEDTTGSDPIGLVTHGTWRYRGRHSLRSVGKSGLTATYIDQNKKALTSLSADIAHIVDLIVTGTITVSGETTFEPSTVIDGGHVTTGRIQSTDGDTYFDLDTPEIVQNAVVNSKAVKVEISPVNPFKLSMMGATNMQDYIYVTDDTGYSGANVLVTSKYDINEDGVVDWKDLKIVFNYVMHYDISPGVAWPAGYPAFARMDVNDNGLVNTADVQEIFEHMPSSDRVTLGSRQLGIDTTGAWISTDWGDAKTYLLEAVVNVKNYGATGDGDTDDTDAFIDAITACAVGGTIVIPTPSVKYKLTDTLIIAKPLRMVGSMGLQDFVSPTGNSANILEFSTTVLIGLDIRSISVESEGFTVDMLSTSADVVAGIYYNVAYAFRFMLARRMVVHLHGNYGTCVKGKNILVSEFDGVQCHGGLYGFFIDECTTIHWTNCWCMNQVAGGEGFHLYTVIYSTLNGCAADSTPHGSTGYNISNCQCVTLTACGSEQWETGFIVSGSFSITLMGCLSASNNALETADASFLKIDGFSQNVSVIGCEDLNPVVVTNQIYVYSSALYPRVFGGNITKTVHNSLVVDGDIPEVGRGNALLVNPGEKYGRIMIRQNGAGVADELFISIKGADNVIGWKKITVT